MQLITLLGGPGSSRHALVTAMTMLGRTQGLTVETLPMDDEASNRSAPSHLVMGRVKRLRRLAEQNLDVVVMADWVLRPLVNAGSFQEQDLFDTWRWCQAVVRQASPDRSSPVWRFHQLPGGAVVAASRQAVDAAEATLDEDGQRLARWNDRVLTVPDDVLPPDQPLYLMSEAWQAPLLRALRLEPVGSRPTPGRRRL